jgi:S1-C subfamily serine protease
MFFLSSTAVLAQQLQQSQPMQRPWIGIVGSDMTPIISTAMGANQTKGFLVAQVTYGSPAHKAGIRGGYITANVYGAQVLLGVDIILKLDNTTVNTINDIDSALNTKKVGDTVQVTVARDNAIKNIGVTLAATPPTFISQPSGPRLQLLGMNTFIDTNELNPGIHIVESSE